MAILAADEVVYANPAFTTLTGGVADPLDALAALLAAGGEDEVRLPLADGRSRRMHATVGAWPAHGEREGWAIVLRPPGTRLRPDAGALVTDAPAWLEGAAPG